MVKNLAFVTYTHTNCKDVWPAYFARLDQFAKDINDYVFVNTQSLDIKNHKFITYDDDVSYSEEYVKNLNLIQEDFVIYMQEDFILYSDVNMNLLNDYVEKLKVDSSISYVRLLRCGDVTNVKHSDNLYYVSQNGRANNSINSFSMQPTIWRKKDLVRLYELTSRKRFGEYIEYAYAMNKLNMNGVYHYNNEPQRGGHYDSDVFPYIATAIVKGKWNTTEYFNELKKVFKEFNINPNIRGCV